MHTVLFHSTVFGPVHSRRLGVSLGINLGPNDGKVCTFDCLYCEAGFNAQGTGSTGLPSREDVARNLEEKLVAMHNAGEKLDVITFSGNGEPTLHPLFGDIVSDTVAIRNRYYPDAKISVLSNSTQLHREDVIRGLDMVDNNILKLDSAIEGTMRVIDRPVNESFTVESVIELLSRFENRCHIQTMMVRGNWEGHEFDNTTDLEVDALIAAYKIIKPQSVMLYSLDRVAPAKTLTKITRDELETVASKMRAEGINVIVS